MIRICHSSLRLSRVTSSPYSLLVLEGPSAVMSAHRSYASKNGKNEKELFSVRNGSDNLKGSAVASNVRSSVKESNPAETSARLLRELNDINRTAVPLTPIRRVLIISRPGRDICKKAIEVARWLVGRNIDVLIGKTEYDALRAGEWHLEEGKGTVGIWTKPLCRDKPDEVDLVVTLGGDGTVLYANYLFQNKVPPVVPFHLGSLGFLTVFDFSNFPDIIERILEGEPQRLNYRTRLQASLYKFQGRTKDISVAAEHRRDYTTANMANYEMPTGKPSAVGHVLNEVVVERGANPTMMTLELFAGNKHLTTLLADGLVIATSTGSTAYNLSAGGSLVHPDKASILVTPICPHTLTTRPMVLPPHLDLRLCVALDTRTTAWISLDGRDRLELSPGDSVLIRSSKHPFTTVCKEDSSSDWFNALVSSLGWNVRRRQRPHL
ncbi:ATP-NAD kinase-like domain-containing protein [Chytridium lagenaria]|nr:ATP-NAD kinase-like domain-containing protein [Chytridium lagenaria]